jgi:anion-transporting  ArsA/GET3 family ATPase
MLSFGVMTVSLFERLERQQLVVVTGKGGVGKTTLTAVLGRRLAAAGRRTLLLEIDPRESLHQLLGTEPSGGEILSAGEHLSAQNLQAQAVIHDLVREKVPIRALARRIVESPLFQHFADGAPGLKEMAVLGYALRMVEGFYRRRVDVVVLDAPATGHGASMLAAPMLLAQSISGGQLGEMAASLGSFIADPSRCGVVVVTMGEEMPVQEAIELVQLLDEKMGRPPELVVANACYPEPPRTTPRDADKAVMTLWRERHAVNRRELRRLGSSWKGPLAELPLLPLDRGPALVDALVAHLEGEA